MGHLKDFSLQNLYFQNHGNPIRLSLPIPPDHHLKDYLILKQATMLGEDLTQYQIQAIKMVLFVEVLL